MMVATYEMMIDGVFTRGVYAGPIARRWADANSHTQRALRELARFRPLHTLCDLGQTKKREYQDIPEEISAPAFVEMYVERVRRVGLMHGPLYTGNISAGETVAM
jgi:hypothetical protein